MTIATTDDHGRPWVSPVFFVPDDDYNLYWVSDKEAAHSTYVRARPEIAIVIHDTCYGKVDAVYITGTAVELTEEADVRLGMDIVSRRPQPERWQIADISVVTHEGPWRIYKAMRRVTEIRLDGEKQGRDVVGRESADF